MIRARLSPRAKNDLDQVCNYITGDNADAAQQVRKTILNTSDFLAMNPAIGRRILGASSRHAAIRWFVVPKYRNYLIFYQPFKDSMVVVRILHAAQDWTRYFPTSREKSG
jgi:plasmid stabilization system protein ParE